MLSKEASSTIFWVFDMTWPGTEPQYLKPLANTLTFNANGLVYIYIYIYIYSLANVDNSISYFQKQISKVMSCISYTTTEQKTSENLLSRFRVFVSLYLPILNKRTEVKSYEMQMLNISIISINQTVLKLL